MEECLNAVYTGRVADKVSMGYFRVALGRILSLGKNEKFMGPLGGGRRGGGGRGDKGGGK